MTETKAPQSKRKTPPDPESESWRKLPWRKFEQHVYRIQKRIFQAEQRGNHRAVHKLQKLLMKSRAARMLAIRRVTQDNQGKKTAGVDGIKAVSPRQRLAMVEQVHPNQWKRLKTQPVRRVYIPYVDKLPICLHKGCYVAHIPFRKCLHNSTKPGKAEKRPLGIPVMVARGQQALVKLALEPEWEAKFEANSYGFRPGRSCHDAIAAIYIFINQKAKYALDADLKGCFDHAS